MQQELQIDELQELKEFLRNYGKPIAVGICVVLAVIIVLVLHHGHAREQIQQASQMLSSARTVKDLETLTVQYSSTPAAPQALMKLAKAHFDSGNYDIALNKYSEFKLKFPNHQMAGGAELGKIHCLEARGQLQEALSAFTAFIAEHPDYFLVSQAIFGQGRCLEQLGRHREAKALYEDFIAAHPESAWIPRAEELLASVSRKQEEAQPGPGEGQQKTDFER